MKEPINSDLLGEDIDVSVESFQRLKSNNPETRYAKPDSEGLPQDTSQLRSLGVTPKRLESTFEQPLQSAEMKEEKEDQPVAQE